MAAPTLHESRHGSRLDARMAQAARSRQARTRLALPVQRDCRGRQIRMSCASSPGKGEIPAQDRGEVPGFGVLLDRSEGVLLGAAVHVHGVAWRAMCPELGRGWRVGIRVEGAKGARDVARTAHALRADHVVRAAARAAILAACGEERGHLSLRCCGVSQRKRRRVRTPRARRGGRRSGLSQRLAHSCKNWNVAKRPDLCETAESAKSSARLRHCLRSTAWGSAQVWAGKSTTTRLHACTTRTAVR